MGLDTVELIMGVETSVDLTFSVANNALLPARCRITGALSAVVNPSGDIGTSCSTVIFTRR